MKNYVAMKLSEGLSKRDSSPNNEIVDSASIGERRSFFRGSFKAALIALTSCSILKLLDRPSEPERVTQQESDALRKEAEILQGMKNVAGWEARIEAMNKKIRAFNASLDNSGALNTVKWKYRVAEIPLAEEMPGNQ